MIRKFMNDKEISYGFYPFCLVMGGESLYSLYIVKYIAR
jgi:hypothetical protein